jgi:hypothetical protein
MTDQEFLEKLADSGLMGEPDAARLMRCLGTYGAMLDTLRKVSLLSSQDTLDEVAAAIKAAESDAPKLEI